jgi:hypothetical protein
VAKTSSYGLGFEDMSVGQIFNFHCLIVALLQLNFYAFEIVLYVMFLKLTISKL